MAEFDWVKARAECSMVNVFMRLKAGAVKDVEAANTVFKGTGRKFALTGNSTSFTIFQDSIPPKSIYFALTENSIVVGNQDAVQKLSATLTLNKDRQCRLVVGDEEMEDWQFLKEALEDLFFSTEEVTENPFSKLGRGRL